MRRVRNCTSHLVAMLLATNLSACAMMRTYEKCGFGGCAGDAPITAQVESLLREHPDLEVWNIHVQTLDHVVYLYGLVDTELQRGIVESIASATPDVTRVVNSIAVRNLSR